MKSSCVVEAFPFPPKSRAGKRRQIDFFSLVQTIGTNFGTSPIASKVEEYLKTTFFALVQ